MAILKYPPPASFLNFTSAKSGSTPVVSQSISRPIVPVGAMTEICGVAIPVPLAEVQGAVPAFLGAGQKVLPGQWIKIGELRRIHADGQHIQPFIFAETALAAALLPMSYTARRWLRITRSIVFPILFKTRERAQFREPSRRWWRNFRR